MRVAYFTAGTHGAGHLVRGLALKRAFERTGTSVEVKLFGPALPFPQAREAHYTPVPIEQAALEVPQTAQASGLLQALRGFSPDLLLVDLYWAPLRHILPLPGCEAWLLARHLPLDWLSGSPKVRFDARQYRRSFSIEPGFLARGLGESVPPVVLVNPDERAPANALREHLGVPAGEPVRVVAHAGLPGEIDGLAEHLPGARRLSLHEAGALVPLAKYLHGADEIVSGAGYNSYWEARWLGYDARTRFVPIGRQQVEQAWRVRHCGAVRMERNGADVLAAMALGRSAES